MAEYIDKVEVGAKIQVMYIRREMDYGGENDFCRGMRKALQVIKNMPAADVQPINPWISVDDALPIYDGLVLAVDKNNTIRLGMYTDLGWTSQFGNPMVAHITHWQPLPEPPKDGEQNDD